MIIAIMPIRIGNDGDVDDVDDDDDDDDDDDEGHDCINFYNDRNYHDTQNCGIVK